MKLEEGLKKLAMTGICSDKKEILKKSVFKQIESSRFAGVTASVSGVFDYSKKVWDSTGIPVARKVEIKERVFEKISQKTKSFFFWQRFFDFNKKFVSSFLLLVIAFGMFSFLGVDTQLARAEVFTTLDSYSGDVVVLRRGEILPAFAGMKLVESDVVYTDKNGVAVIQFLDRSVSRLSSNTEVFLDELRKHDDVSAKTSVKISVVSGSVWSKVLNLVGDDSFFVVKAGDVYTKAQRAAFNVNFQRNDVSVEVFNHAVEIYDVKTKSSSEKVVSGYRAVKNSGKKVVEIKPVVLKKNDLAWVRDNLRKDETYLANVQETVVNEKRESLGLEPGNSDYSFNTSIREKTAMMFTFDDIKKKQMELDIAEKDFVAAYVRLSEPNLNDEEKQKLAAVTQNFAEKTKEFYAVVDDVKDKDSKYADELKKYVDDKIAYQKKDLSLVLPDSPIYEAKKIVDDLDLNLAKNPVDIAKVKVDNAVDKLADAEVMANKGDIELASALVTESEKDLNEATLIVNEVTKANESSVIPENTQDNGISALVTDTVNVVSEKSGEVSKMELESMISDAGVIKDNVQLGIKPTNLEGVDLNVKNVEIKIEPIVKLGEFGVLIEGDKPLPPL